jgi:hypothetical protein
VFSTPAWKCLFDVATIQGLSTLKPHPLEEEVKKCVQEEKTSLHNTKMGIITFAYTC